MYLNLKRLTYIAIAVIGVTAITISCSNSEANSNNPGASVKEGVILHNVDTVDYDAITGDWVYRTVKNNLTDIPTHYAECPSKSAKHILDDTNLDIDLTIMLMRKQGYRDEVILSGKNGVFNVGNKVTIVQVRFDNGPVETYKCSVNEEYLSGGLIVEDAPRFISRVRESDSCRIATTYLHNGELIFTHNLKGLRW